MDQHDRAVRQAAFDYLNVLTEQYGDVLPYARLSEGFDFKGDRVPLLAPTGIFKPRILQLPLTINTAPSAPYPDRIDQGTLHYRYRGTDSNHRDNKGMKAAMEARVPLIYLHGLVKGKYIAAWPVYITGADDIKLTFMVQVDKEIVYPEENVIADVITDIETNVRRRYATRETTVRLHQRGFRERVIRAYREQCALCRLRHQELLDAAHIIPDADDAGEPVVNNGISLCKIHHAAFDHGIIGIRPDYVVEVRVDVLHEIDGPMLKYGLQLMHNTRLIVPQNVLLRPDPEKLETRYSTFRERP
jgi:putative restriction endonuclease